MATHGTLDRPQSEAHWTAPVKMFADGFQEGWDDALLFALATYGDGEGVSELGLHKRWFQRRFVDYRNRQQHIDLDKRLNRIVTEPFEMGFRRGYDEGARAVTRA